MQFLKTIPRLFTPHIPRTFYLPALTANFATTDKNKQIVSKTERKVAPIPEYDLSDFQSSRPQEKTPDFASSLIETRFVYSEKEQKLIEVPVVPSLKKKNEILKEQKAIEKARKEAEALEKGQEPELPEETERLSKRMSRLGVCSRRQAERMIALGLVRVNNKKVDSNVPVLLDDKITIFTQHGERMPMKQDTKIWAFNKPKGLICTHDDPMGRHTIFEYLRSKGFSDDHFISVGRLDYLSEGLILLTNDGELAQALEQPSSQISRAYRVRVFGQLDADKLQKIRRGAVINGVRYGPYFVEVEKKQTRNTWLRMRLSTGKNREIRRIMQKFSLRVNRLQRVNYGPYSLGRLESGDFVELKITDEVKRVLYMRLRHKTEEKQEEEQLLLEQKRQEQIQLSGSEFQQLPFRMKTLSGPQSDIVPKAVMTTRRIEEGIKQAQDETSQTPKKKKSGAKKIKKRNNPFDLSEAETEFAAKERSKSRSQYIRRRKATATAEKEKQKRATSENREKRSFSKNKARRSTSEGGDRKPRSGDSSQGKKTSDKPRGGQGKGGRKVERRGGQGYQGERGGSAQNKKIVTKKIKA